MSFGNAEAVQADVIFRANWSEFSGDMAKIRESAEQTYGALDSSTLKAALASEKYDRALARSKGSSYAVAKATAVYKSELAAIDAAQSRAAAGSGRHSGALKQEERQLGLVARGALVGSGALGHLGRAAIFASSSLLGGYGLLYALRSTIGAARNQEIALGHLQVALTDSGLSWQANKDRIDNALSSLVKMTGFTEHELTDALASSVRRYGDLTDALHTTALAADVARAKDISLADAQAMIIRASLGQSKAVKALGIDVAAVTPNLDALRATTKNATKEQIAAAKAADQQASRLGYLDAIQQKYHGNAARFLQTDAGKQAIFNAELDRTEEIVGSGVLPTFNHYLTALSNYLDKLNRSGKLQKDVNRVVHDADTAAHDAAVAVGFLSHNLGGAKTILEALLAFKVASTVGGWTRSIAGLIGKAGAGAGEGEGLAGAARSAGLLKSDLIALSAAPYIITLEVVGLEKAAAMIKALQQQELDAQYRTSSSKVVDTLAAEFAGKYQALRRHGDSPAIAFAALRELISAKVGGNEEQINQILAAAIEQPGVQAKGHRGGEAGTVAPKHGLKGGTSRGGGGRGGGNPLDGGLPYGGPFGQNALLEAQATPGTADDLRILNGQLAELNRALDQKGLSPADRNQLLQERNDVLNQRDQLITAATDARKQAAAAAARRRTQLYRSQTQIPAALVKKLADAQRTGKPLDTVTGIIRAEERALEQQARKLKDEGAPESYQATIAKELKRLHDEIQTAIAHDRSKRIAKLDAIPTDLKLAEANAIANNASEERLLAIYRKQKQKLDAQLHTLEQMKATKEEILKNRLQAAAVEKKIQAIDKHQSADASKLINEFLATQRGFYGTSSDDFTTLSDGSRIPGATPGTSVTVHQHFPAPPRDQHRQARYAYAAMQAVFD